MRLYLKSILVISFISFLDRISKSWIIHSLDPGESFPVSFFLHITRVNNTGAAFGLLRGAGFFLVLTSIVILVCLMVYLARLKRDRFGLKPWAVTLLAAGALGNLYDRLVYGYVVDFIDFRIWPVFNIADISICAGAGLMILSIFRDQRQSHAPNSR